MDEYIIAVDFDGVLCEDNYPEIGAPNTEVIDYIKKKQRYGASIILWTCRVGESLKSAVDWCCGQGLAFDAVNENLPSVIEKYGTDNRKIFASLYIDDHGMSLDELYRELDEARFHEALVSLGMEVDSDE